MTSASTSWPSRPASGAGHRDGSSRSRATLRSARWMRTRTAPSDRPRTPAISAVDISSTKRRTIARRRSSGSRPTAARPRRVVAPRRVALRGRPARGDRAGRLERCLRAAAPPAAALGDRVAGDLEEPDAERRGTLAVGRAGTLLEPGEVRQGGEERALRGVLRLVMVAQLVERVAVHLGQVLPIQGLEPGRVRLRRLDEPTVAVEMDEARTPLLRTVHLPECRSGHGVTPPPRSGSPSRTWRISPTRTWRRPARSRRRRRRAHRSRRRRRGRERSRSPSGVSSRIVRPVVTWRPAQAAPSKRPARRAVDERLEPLEEGIKQVVPGRSRRPAASRTARSSRRPGPAGNRPPPSRR